MRNGTAAGYGRAVGNVSLSFAGAQLVPMACGALFWPKERALLVADLHLEKGSSFARHGWLLPPYDSIDTLDRLAAALAITEADRLFALGDSFHDVRGASRLGVAARTRLQGIMQSCMVTWITGNHDADSGAALGGQALVELELGGIMLRHEAVPTETRPEISGHFHPKTMLVLRTGRHVSRRCFAQTAKKLVLPAYGSYAGGLDIGDPAFATALGHPPDALVSAAGKLLRLPANGDRTRQEKVA